MIFVVLYRKSGKQGGTMPICNHEKFKKYTLKKDKLSFDVEEAIAELVSLCEKTRMRNINITLLADDFFNENFGNVVAFPMYNKEIVPSHNHDYFEINYVEKGKCVECIGSRVFVLEEGDFLIMPPTVYHAPNPVGDSKCIDILIKSEYISSTEKRILTYTPDSYLTRLQNQNTYMVFSAKEHAAFETAKQLTMLFSGKEKQHKHHEIYAECLAAKMLLELSECACTETFYTLQKKRISSNTTEDVLQYIKDNLSTVNLENTASHFGYSPAHLSRLIKKYTGNSFSTYLMLQRILRAYYLLSKTDLAIGKIPSMIGIESKEYLSRVFKKYNFVSPMQYRKMHKLNSSAITKNTES